MKAQRKIAVIGGGVFGATSAIFLSRAGHEVTLFEMADELLTAASGINQYRMHRGYHYPRSAETIESCKSATPQFEEFYAGSIIRHLDHYYAIASERSLLDGAAYLAVLDRHRLPYELCRPQHLDGSRLDLVVKVREHLYDPFRLRKIISCMLADCGVEVRLNTRADLGALGAYDHIVVATYASLNESLGPHVELHRPYQFEVCEKIVVEIPESMRGISTVVMDGPFLCFDPLGDTGYAVMGHVEHAIHHRSFGLKAEVPPEILPLLNQGLIRQPPVTRQHLILDEGKAFMPALAGARHCGSMFTIRTVLPGVDATDTRPTLVSVVDDRTITVYSGKIGNSVMAAKEVVALIGA